MRGIQEHQVWAAADLLIAAGERPTIEKVRQKLGRAEAQSGQQCLREEHAAAIAARDQADRKQADRQDVQEKRLLLEIDRARVSSDIGNCHSDDMRN